MGRTVGPGETVRVEYWSGSGRPGKRKLNTAVYTNDRHNPRIPLWVDLHGRRAINVECDENRFRQCDFGSFERDVEPQTHTIKIRRGDGAPLGLEILRLEKPGASAELRTIDAGEHYEIDVTILMPWPNGHYHNSIEVATGVTEQPEDRIRFRAYYTPRLRAEPHRFEVPIGARLPLDLAAKLYWSGRPPGHILTATVDDPRLEVRVEHQEDLDVVKLHVPTWYSLPRGEYRTVRVTTDDAELPELRIATVVSWRVATQE